MTLDVTGERFIPEAMGGELIEAEHVARYAVAAQLVAGKRVLDAGCGVGWGTGLLLAAGASKATGLDLDGDAVENACGRVPDAEFVVGDLASLPWDDDTFDVVVCFEALEHVAEQDQALDEMVRVLAPDGLLLLSSPNPRVYPCGNPFHLHEFTPEELEAAVASRLTNVAQWNQHTQIASIVVRQGAFPAGESREALARLVAPLRAGTDPYSVVVGGRGDLPSLLPLVVCAPSDPLTRLEELGASLVAERERMTEERAHAANEIEALRREREHLAALLLETEQQIADPLGSAARLRDREAEHAPRALADELARLRREVEVFRTSRSWRLTAPLRYAKRLLAAKR